MPESLFSETERMTFNYFCPSHDIWTIENIEWDNGNSLEDKYRSVSDISRSVLQTRLHTCLVLNR